MLCTTHVHVQNLLHYFSILSRETKKSVQLSVSLLLDFKITSFAFHVAFVQILLFFLFKYYCFFPSFFIVTYIIAYREFCRLVYGFLGKRRIPLPACAYTSIRKQFPLGTDENYTGFELEDD